MRFSVGEIAVIVGGPGNGNQCTIDSELVDFDGFCAPEHRSGHWCKWAGGRHHFSITSLRKLPPDSHADTTTEDPGVTRIKKLLERDVVKVKRPVKA